MKKLFLCTPFVFALLLFSSACSQKPISTTSSKIERDWTIESDLLLNTIKAGKSSFLSFQVYRRHPHSPTRMINFGSFPKDKMRMKAWVVSVKDISEIMAKPQYRYQDLLTSPQRLADLEKDFDQKGQSIGDVANSKKYGDGHFFSDGSAGFHGMGTVPRISNIPDSLYEGSRVVVMIKSTPSKMRNSKNKEITYGRSYFYQTEKAMHLISAPTKLTSNKSAFYNYTDRNDLKAKVIDQKTDSSKPGIIGVAKRNIPYDHHIAIGWK